jgi:hypothetical protein
MVKRPYLVTATPAKPRRGGRLKSSSFAPESGLLRRRESEKMTSPLDWADDDREIDDPSPTRARSKRIHPKSEGSSLARPNSGECRLALVLGIIVERSF